MTKKKKILLIVLLSLVAFIVGLFFLVKIYKVEINFLSTQSYYQTETVNDCKKDINFFSTTLIFNKKRYMQILEKNNPYLKVVSIECKFPCKIVVHCVEREPFYYVEDEQNFILLDGELKVLNIAQEVNVSSLIKIEDTLENIERTSINVGEKIIFKNQKNQEILESIYSANVQNLKTVTDFTTLYKKVQINRVLSPTTLNFVSVVNLELRSGATLQIYDAKNSFAKKLQYANLMLASLSPVEKQQGTILVFENTNNKIESRYFIEE